MSLRIRLWSLTLLVAAVLPPPALASGDLPVTEVKSEVRLEGLAPTVFEQLGKLYGVPVRVTEELPRRTLRLRLEEADFATALRVAAKMVGAFWTVQEDGSVLVALDTAENRSRYEPQLEKTFFLPGRSPEELADAVRLLREVLDMRRIRPDPRSQAVVVRDTPLRLAVAEQLLAQLQEDPGEIWLEVLLLEVDREEAQRLGLFPPDQIIAVHLGAGALILSDIDSLFDILEFLFEQGLLPRAVTDAILRSVLAGGVLDPSAITVPPFILVGGGGTTYATLLPGAELNLRRLARTLRSARRLHLRARDAQEASLFVGERFPVAFTTFSSIFIPEIVQELIRRGLFVPPVPAVRYEELGVRLTVRPRLHTGRDISLALKLDQRALTAQTFNGIPVLSSRVLEQQVRLRSGETLLIAGLQQQTVEETRTGTPGLGSLPVIGNLFRRTEPTTRSTELVLLVTPHLVRLPAQERLAVRTLYVGTEKDFSPLGPAPAPTPTPPPTQPGAPPPGAPPPPRPPQPQPPPPQPQPQPQPPPQN